MFSAFLCAQSGSEAVGTSEGFQHRLSKFREDKLSSGSDPAIEVYRLFISPTFSHPVAIRVEKKGNEYLLIGKYFSGMSGYEWGKLKKEKRRRIKEEEWNRLVYLLDEALFWKLEPEDEPSEPNEKGEVTICLDGTGYYLEGLKAGRHHLVERYCPDSESFRAVGTFLVTLSTLNLKPDDYQ
jgi:hypothetical protein